MQVIVNAMCIMLMLKLGEINSIIDSHYNYIDYSHSQLIIPCMYITAAVHDCVLGVMM